MSISKKQSPIWLIGYMGSGKSSVGKLLAGHFGHSFADSDEWIAEQSGKSVSKLFEQEGEAVFRMWEQRFVEQVSDEKQVLSCGGGLPCFHGLMEKLLEKGTVVYLETSVETLTKRLKNEAADRPLLKGLTEMALPEAIRERLQIRKPIYELADLTVATDGKSPEKIAEEIAAAIYKV